ncbi:Serine/threonine-protein kinase [Actinidia chinensis var. chinensis]|uniref:Serine/threonine-protein kinase n=1 Tax=Actinidia chinensis var. chinensis TaxID=1590841 RepID=A0A2R6Q653_ACTCC|nr:Serine/threonine-protein kinase [Actinidia chinensis var. chinensis]
MDLETENRIAAILMKEAAELRRQGEKEGVQAYLRQPKFRGRPNSRFLTATVLGVQQANRVVEVNEMWRVRQKELELDDRLRVRLRDDSSSDRSNRDSSSSKRSTNKRHIGVETSASVPCSSSKRAIQDCYSREYEVLKDEDIDEFLHSRVKRGRGAVGSRMDETGPYLPTCSDSLERQFTCSDIGGHERWELRVLGLEKPSSLKHCESSEEESRQDKRKKDEKVGSSKRHSRKHKSKDKSRDKKKKRREEKRRKHHK